MCCRQGQDQHGDEICSNCLTGQYSTAVGAIANTCVACPEKSNLPEASGIITECTCNAGSTGSDGTVCMHCDTGKYKTLSGDAVCDSSKSGTFSTIVGAATPSVC